MDKTVVGLVPFIGVHRVIMSERSVSATYGGGALAGHFELDGEFLEVTAGTGLVRMRGVEDWWAPIFGVRGGP